jgi:hypothetical protein
VKFCQEFFGETTKKREKGCFWVKNEGGRRGKSEFRISNSARRRFRLRQGYTGRESYGG